MKRSAAPGWPPSNGGYRKHASDDPDEPFQLEVTFCEKCLHHYASRLQSVRPMDPPKKISSRNQTRSSEIFFLSEIQMFREYAQKDLIGSSFLSRLRSRFVKGRVFTEDGKLFDAVFDSSLRKELSDLRNKTRQQEPGRPSADLGAMD